MSRSYLYILLIITLASCANDQVKIPNVDHITLDNKMIRFDKLLLDDKSFVSAESITTLMEEHPDFSEIYIGAILHLVDPSTGQLIENDVIKFTTDPLIKGIQDTIDQTFVDFEKQTKDIDNAFKLLKHYFPKYPTPSVYFANTLFNYQSFTFNDTDRDGIGIGLDMFCNQLIDYKSIDPTNPTFSNYLTRSFNPDHLSKKIIDRILDEICGEAPGVRLIDIMIHEGKKHFIMDKLLPMVEDSIVMEYSESQMNWVDDNELEMWSFYLEKELFYETNQRSISKYIDHSPNAPGMPIEAPGRTANYLGWQIVKSYMTKFPETSLMDLIALNDSQRFLEESAYRPKRKK